MMPVSKTKRRSERRQRPRADARLSMRVESRHEDDAHIVTESQNISASGVYCTSSRYLAPLSKVALTIVLPRLPGRSHAQELVKCEGIVVRCDPQSKRAEHAFQLACMFTALDARRRELLEEFVAWRNLQALRAATTAARTNGRAPAGRVRATAKRATKKTAARKVAVRTTTRRTALPKAAAGARAAARRATAARGRASGC
jgi:hypothetical protein